MKPNIKDVNVTISTGAIFKVLAVVFGIWVFWVIRDVIALFFVAILLAALIDPFTDWFVDKGVPKGLSVLIIYLFLLLVIVLSVLIIIPPLIEQLSSLGVGLAETYGSARGVFDGFLDVLNQYGLSDGFSQSFSGLQDGLTRAVSGVFSSVANVFNGFLAVLLVSVLTFYMIVEEDFTKKIFHHFAPKKYQPYLLGLAHRMQDKLGAWLRGQLLLMLVVGALTYVGLLIVGVEYSLVLGIFAGMAEIVPYAGPIISMVPAVIVAFAVSPVKAAIVVLLYFGVQQLENSVFTPMIMQKSVGLNPVVSLFALLVGFEIGGFMGALLAIPVATLVAVLVRDLVGEYDSEVFGVKEKRARK